MSDPNNNLQKLEKIEQTAALNLLTEQLQDKFQITQEDLRAHIKPLFLFMHKHGISEITVTCIGSMANVKIL